MFALYRKYRPKNFGELLGQEEIVRVLKNSAAQGKLAHAYIFSGPRGTGKTTIARLIAKIANCKSPAAGEPCNRCGRCEEIDAGRALDVVEIDAASNRGIDEIRGLKEGVRVSPSVYDFKIFIIDEAHMLTREAFNALLKTLEEPPAHSILILATTELEKIPATISSRCQRFRCKKLPAEQIIQKLRRIAAEEKIKIADDALELVAASAEGSLRDAESLLGQITAFSGGEATAETAEKIIGKAGRAKVAAFTELLLAANLGGSLKYLADLDAEGCNLVDFSKELIHHWRRVLSLKCDSSLEKIYANEITKKDLETLKVQSAAADPKKHVPLLKSLIRAYGEMRYSPFAAIPLEVAIIENLHKEA